MRLLAAAALVPLVVPAGADHVEAGPGLEVSRDRVHWATGLDGTLFSPDLAWSPGERRTSTFLVRNDATHPVDVSVDLDAHPTGGVSVALDTADDVRRLAAGAVEPVSVTARAGADAVDLHADPTVDVRVEVADGPDEQGSVAERARLALAPVFVGLALLAAALVAGRGRLRKTVAS